MPYGAEFADPLVDVRDVVETFRHHGFLVPEWRESLTLAADTLERLPVELRTAAAMDDLVMQLRHLLAHGLAQELQAVHAVSAQVADLLDQTRVPGVPRPEDERWDFG